MASQRIPYKRCGINIFTAAHGTPYKIDDILGHRASLNRYRETETMPYIISDHHGIKLEIAKEAMEIL